MQKKVFSGIILVFLLAGMFAVTFDIQLVEAEPGTIYIRADGSIDPPTAPIVTTDAITYTLIDNIVGSIIVERDNIVLDGEDKTLTGYDEWYALSLSGVSNVTVQGMNVDMSFLPGGTPIYLYSSSNCTIKENIIHMADFAFWLESSSDNTIVGNTISTVWLIAIYLYGDSTRNVIFHNNFDDVPPEPVATNGLVNFFSIDYPWGGNYWGPFFSDEDLYSGEFQDQPGSDGIWDHPYVFDANNVDKYPFTQADGWSDMIPPGYPVITLVTHTPTTPSYNQEALVTAKIIDDVAVDHALLSYTQATAWHNVSMNRLGDVFNASIPAQPYATPVQYKVYAVDTGGNWSVSGLHSYTVGDIVAPEVIMSHIPAYPLPMQTVKVYAEVTEPVDASGVKTVLFHYRTNGGSWWNTTMAFNGALGLYETTIPAYEKHDFIEYFVEATDNVGNINTTSMQHYEVLRCDASHNGVVDVYDIHMIAKAWMSEAGQLEYILEADINEDGVIDTQDLYLVKMQYGKDP